jgi:hypothetical protein
MSTRIVQLTSVALLVLAAGCAGPLTENGSASTQPGAWPSASAVDLAGTWRGAFGEVGAGSGHIHGDIVCQINGDGTYKGTWVNYVVAGSSRGGRREMSGRVVADGGNVTFNDSSGSQMILKRNGNTLYGVTLDPSGKRATLSIELRRTPEAP